MSSLRMGLLTQFSKTCFNVSDFGMQIGPNGKGLIPASNDWLERKLGHIDAQRGGGGVRFEQIGYKYAIKHKNRGLPLDFLPTPSTPW